MKGIHIIATGRAIPACGYDNNKMKEFVDTDDEWIRTRTGIENRYICKEESCVSLAIEAGKRAMEKAGNPVEQVMAVIVATSTPDQILPSVACQTAKALGLGKDVLAFDLSAACSGFLYGVEVARGLVHMQKDQYVLVIGAEQLSRIMDYTDRNTCILFGDGAGAALIGAADAPYLNHSGCDADMDALRCNGLGYEDQFVHMNGHAVFKFAVTILRRSVDRLLKELSISLDDVDYVICHQANARIIDHVKKKYKGYEDKFPMNLSKYGNTSAASIPILLDEMFEQGKLKTGMKLICVGFGAGLTWSGTYLQV